MLSAERELQILNIINDHGAVVVRDLAQQFSVTEATIRRDLQRMEDQALLRRTHGGAVSVERLPEPQSTPTKPISPITDNHETETDALIISPLNNREAHTLREKAIRNGIPLLAESMPQEGAVYLGARNFDAGYDLGLWAGQYIANYFDVHPVVLNITQQMLTNTQERSRGFIAGLDAVLDDDFTVITAESNGLYGQSYQLVAGALASQPEINVMFGINDDSILAGLQAYHDTGYRNREMLAVNVGGEGSTIFDALARDNSLKACVGLFPEVVGRVGVDAVWRLWAEQDVPDAIYTPHMLLTEDNVGEFYGQSATGWALRPERISDLVDAHWQQTPQQTTEKQLSFVIHYRTHEWYQNMAAAMQERAREIGVRFAVHDMETDIKAEIRDLRRLIGKLAATYVEDGDTIIMDNGSTTLAMAHFLEYRANVTIITNSFDVFEKLRHRPNLKLILTGGDYDPETGAFSGRGAQLLLNEVRADKFFMVAGGVSESFGVSSVTMHEAEIRRRMIESSREVIVLADHTVFEIDSNVSVASLDAVDTLITDAGISAKNKFNLIQRGIQVISAGSV